MTEPSQNKRGRPKGSVQELNLTKTEALAQVQATEMELAIELGVSVDTIQRRMKSNPQFKKAYAGGKNRGKLAARRNLYLSIMDKYLTICKNPDCEKIKIDTDRFYVKCPYCKSIGEDGTEYSVKHVIKDGNPRLMELFAKNYLGLSDKVEIGGDKEKPILFSTLAEFSIHMAKKHGYGRKKSI
jgi:hypothetical protein